MNDTALIDPPETDTRSGNHSRGQQSTADAQPRETPLAISDDQLAPHDHVAVETTWHAQITLPAVGNPFHACLIREDRRWFDDDPNPDIAEQIVCERDFSTPLPTVWAAIDQWLFTGHKLRVLPHSWAPCEAGNDVGCALLLEGRAVPVHPINGPLGCWG